MSEDCTLETLKTKYQKSGAYSHGTLVRKLGEAINVLGFIKGHPYTEDSVAHLEKRIDEYESSLHSFFKSFE